jgi:hypothetical protein
MKLNFRLPAEDTPDAGGAGKGAGDGANKGGADDAAAAAAAAAAAGKGAGAGADDKGDKGNKDGKGGTDDAAAAAAAAAAAGAKKAPDKYTLTVPEGGRLEAGDLAEIEALARANDLTQEEAAAYLADVDARVKATSDKWAAETKADPDLGGDKLAATQVLTKAAIDKLFPVGDPHRDGFIAFLGRGGAGNNINVVRALARIGQWGAEDKPVGGNSGGGGEKREDVPLANRMYPNAPV